MCSNLLINIAKVNISENKYSHKYIIMKTKFMQNVGPY